MTTPVALLALLAYYINYTSYNGWQPGECKRRLNWQVLLNGASCKAGYCRQIFNETLKLVSAGKCLFFSFSCLFFLFVVYPIQFGFVIILTGWCKNDITPLLTHWSYVFLSLTHRFVVGIVHILQVTFLDLSNCLTTPVAVLVLRMKGNMLYKSSKPWRFNSNAYYIDYTSYNGWQPGECKHMFNWQVLLNRAINRADYIRPDVV